jgi:hypothetical protein
MGIEQQRIGGRCRARVWGLSSRLGRLGPLAPFVTLEAFSPGAWLLLAQAEQRAERILHLLRLVLIPGDAGLALALFGTEIVRSAPGRLVATEVVLILLLWALV